MATTLRPLSLAARAGVAAAGACVAAIVLGGLTRLPITVLFGVILVGSLAMTAPMVRARVGPRAPIVLAVAAAALSPCVYVAAAIALSEPIVSAHFRGEAPLASLIVFAPPLLVIFAGVATLLAHWVVGRERRWLDRGLVLGTLVALVVGTLATTFAVRRSFAKPDPDRWIAAQPVVAELSSLRWSHTEVAPAHPADRPLETLRARLDAHTTLFSTCDAEGRCELSLLGSDRKPGPVVGVAAGRVILRSAQVGYVFSGADGGSGALDKQGVPQDLEVQDLATELSAPRGWIAGAGAALALAALAVVRARRCLARRDLVDGVVDGASVRLADGGRWPLPPGTTWPDGARVVACFPRVMPTFRSDHTPSLELGSTGDSALDARARTTFLFALAWASLALGVAPLLAAASQRLVF